MIKYFLIICYLLLLTVQIGGRRRIIVKRKTTPPTKDNTVETWKGKWFPGPPHPKDTWKGKWFPYAPYTNEQFVHENYKTKLTATEICDDGKQFIGIDYDPSNVQQTFEHFCLANRSLYTPKLNVEALRTEHFIPPAYVAPVKCLNESIDYDTTLPTYGAFRPLMPKFGTYTFLPPQRWLAAMSRGAIVMLYHPCAFGGQVKILQNTLRSCLYRHIISPSQLLSAERPMALLAWGKSLEMSVVDDHMVVDFIKQNAKQGPNFSLVQQNNTKIYEAGLIQEAHLITDNNDSEVCGYKEGM